MLSENDMKEIVDRVVVEVLVKMPEVIGNLIKNHATINKLNHKFYNDNPEFAQHKDVVVKVLEQVEGRNLGLKYEDILDEAKPIIKDRIKVVQGLDMGPKINEIKTEIDFISDGKSNGVI